MIIELNPFVKDSGFLKYKNPVTVAAHRGNSIAYPENTLPAFQSALDINVDMIVQNISRKGYTDLSFTVLKEDLAKTMRLARQVARDIDAGGVLQDKDIAKVSVVGLGMRSHSGIAARMFQALASQKVNIEMISTSEIKISCVIEKRHAEKAVRAIHEEFGLGKKTIIYN